jgi:hypothetical protein
MGKALCASTAWMQPDSEFGMTQFRVLERGETHVASKNELAAYATHAAPDLCEADDRHLREPHERVHQNGQARGPDMGRPLNPHEAEKNDLVHETVSGKAIDRAMEIAKRFCSHTPESLGYIKRLVRNAIDTPLAEGLALERNLFMRLCVSDEALARMRSYEAKKITDPSRSLEA